MTNVKLKCFLCDSLVEPTDFQHNRFIIIVMRWRFRVLYHAPPPPVRCNYVLFVHARSMWIIKRFRRFGRDVRFEFLTKLLTYTYRSIRRCTAQKIKKKKDQGEINTSRIYIYYMYVCMWVCICIFSRQPFESKTVSHDYSLSLFRQFRRMHVLRECLYNVFRCVYRGENAVIR